MNSETDIQKEIVLIDTNNKIVKTRNKKIVFAQGAANDIQYPNVGNAEFPKVHEHNQRTIRFYSNSTESFAYKLAHIAYPTKNLKIGPYRDVRIVSGILTKNVG